MNFFCFCLVSGFAVAAMALPANTGNSGHPVLDCISQSGLTQEEQEMAVSPVGPLGDEQTSFVKCVLLASKMIDAEENFQYDAVTAIYTAQYKNHPDYLAKSAALVQACKGLSGTVAVKGCIESNGGKIL